MNKLMFYIIMANLLRICQEAVASVVGETAAETAMGAPTAGSLAARLKALKTAYDADPDVCVASQVNLTELQAIRTAYEGIAFDSVDSISDATAALEVAVA